MQHQLTSQAADEPFEKLRSDLAACRQLSPASAPELSEILIRLAKCLKASDQREESETLYREALELRRASLPPNHLGIASASSFLGRLLDENGKFADAECCYREALAIYRVSLPADHPNLNIAVRDLAAVLQEMGGNLQREADALFREAIVFARNASCDNAVAVAESLSDLGGWLTDRGEVAEAEELLTEALSIHRRNRRQ